MDTSEIPKGIRLNKEYYTLIETIREVVSAGADKNSLFLSKYFNSPSTDLPAFLDSFFSWVRKSSPDTKIALYELVLKESWRSVFNKQDMKILMVGSDAVGKTSILYHLKLGEVITTIPTIGFNVETVEYKNSRFTMWDIGGGDKIKLLWRHYFAGLNALAFVVDSNDTDRDRIDTAREDIQRLLIEEELRDVPFLIYANTQDLPGAMTASQVTEELGMHTVKNRKWYVQPCCATTGEGLLEGLDWLCSELRFGSAPQPKHELVNCPPHPMSEKYSQVEICVGNTQIKDCGLRLFCNVLCRGHDLSDEIVHLSKFFPVSEEDYFVTIAFNGNGITSVATDTLKNLVTAAMGCTLLHPLSYRVANCFNVAVESIEGKPVICVKLKPEYKIIAESVHDLLRCFIPLEGENDTVGIEWNIEGDCESFANYPDELTKFLMSSQLKYSANMHTEHYRAVLEFARNYVTQIQAFSPVLTQFVFAILNMVSGKANINLAWKEQEEIKEDTPGSLRAEIKRGKENGGMKKLLDTIPLCEKVFEFFRDCVEEAEVNVYLPRIRGRLNVTAKNLSKLLTAFI